MRTSGAVLIADDEHSFLRSTTELLRKEGYECDAACDAAEGIRMLEAKRYDLLIADVMMPGNQDAFLVRRAKTHAPGLPVILVTGFPSLRSAVESIELSAVAYLIKPIDYDVLLEHIEAAMKSRPLFRMLTQIHDDLQTCGRELEAVLAEAPQHAKPGAHVGFRVPALTTRRLASCLGELLKVQDGLARRGLVPRLCQMIECPGWPAHQAAFRDVVQVLQEIKRRFKSKELAELRDRIERHLGTQGQ